MGMSPMRDVTECRMQGAIPLLEGTELSVMEIAERSGYRSEIAFRKAFRSVIGRLPGEVRRTCRGRAGPSVA
jgi:transcriptional regulator GlxA family with amidase domain